MSLEYVITPRITATGMYAAGEQLREMTTRLLTELRHNQALNAKLSHENALLKRMKFHCPGVANRRGVMERLDELLPHRWQAESA